MRALIDAGADCGATLDSGFSGLMAAARRASREEVRLLLDCGAPVNATSRAGDTALMWAVSAGHIEVARLLLERGADPSLRSPKTSVAELAEGQPAMRDLLSAFERGDTAAAKGRDRAGSVDGLELWTRAPAQPFVALPDLGIQVSERAEVDGARAGDFEMEDATLRTLIEAKVVRDARRAAADALLVREARVNQRTETKSTESVGDAVLTGLIGGATGRTIVTLPGTKTMVERTLVAHVTPIRFRTTVPAGADPQGNEAEAWRRIEGVTDSASFREYLTRFPSGMFAERARLLLTHFAGREEKERQPAAVYLYRVKGAPGRPSLFVDGVEAARLEGNRYVKLLIPGGDHLFVSADKKRPPTALTLVGGDMYFLRCDWSFRRDDFLDLIQEGTARDELVKMQPLDAKWHRSTTLVAPAQDLP